MARSTAFSRKAKILSCLIQTGYLPSEVPPTITSRNFANLIKNQPDKFFSYTPKSATQFERFSIPRENGSRRDLAVTHPSAQLAISALITENYQIIKDKVRSDKLSLYDTESDFENFRAFKGISFRNLDELRTDLSVSKPFVVHADISRFFYTVYTHSIPWAVLGKKKVKDSLTGGKKKKLDNHWSGKVDRFLQVAQSRETFGIPVGPDTSRIVAEILLSGLQSDTKFTDLLGIAPGYRLVDDFFIGFDTVSECEAFLVSLRNALSAYNLQLNDDKTWIKPSREIFTDKWRQDLANARIPIHSARIQESAIRSASEIALYHASLRNDGIPVKWFINSIVGTVLHAQNYFFVLKILLRFSRDFPTCVDVVSVFIINNKNIFKNKDSVDIITRWVRDLFRNHDFENRDFEISWALVVCGSLKISVSKSYFEKYSESMSSVVMASLGLLRVGPGSCGGPA